MDDLVHELADNPAAPDWERLLSYLRLTREHPAHSLEVLTRLAHCREALALMLFKASEMEDDFDLAWSLADEMPFAWYLLPASCWLTAAAAYFGQLRKSLSTIEGGDAFLTEIFEKFRKRTTERLSGFSILCDWLQEALFPDIPMQDRTLIWMRTTPEQMAEIIDRQVSELQGELQGRLDSDARWPEAPRVSEQTSRLPQPCRFEGMGYRRGVLCAPFVAAGIFARDWHCSEAMILELRHLRAFDHQWLDRVFGMRVGLGLAKRRAGD